VNLTSRIFSILSASLILWLIGGPTLSCDAGQVEEKDAGQNQAVELLLRARQFAIEVDDSEQRDVLMGDIAQDLYKLGETKRARDAFALINSDSWRDSSQKPMLERQLRAREFVEAQWTVEAMKTVQGKAEALCSVASALWEADMHAAARRTLSAVMEIYAQHRPKLNNSVFLEELRLTQDELGDAAGASKTKQELAKVSGGYSVSVCKWGPGYLDSESNKLRLAGRAETEKGDLEAARSTLRRAAHSIGTAPGEDAKATLLGRIATDQANAEDLEGARVSFSQAVERAVALPNGLQRNLLLREIARDQASAGDIEGGLITATKISDIGLKDQAVHGIAVSGVEQVGLESGLKNAEKIQTDQEYDVTLVDVARYLGKQQDAPTVLLVVDKIHSPYMKALGLEEAAEAVIKKK
jgi:hypothetical protein